ncbi:metallophosphoesterase family protein [Streptomyces sp. NPDC096057]|uniref:purple acid phosphatase family protein n=1 Tax=Streptomyces sp. NPDC096057 TaxID=3155543 RepID=UPI00333334A6
MKTPRNGIEDRLAAGMTMAEQHEYLRTKLTRRSLVRGGAAVAGALAGPGLGLAPAAAHGRRAAATPILHSPYVDGSLVAPFGRHLAFGSDARTQMRISWQVPLAVKRPYIRVGTEPWELSRKIEAEVRVLHTPVLTSKAPAVDQYYLHAALDGLRPGTTYYYGVGHDGFDPASPRAFATVGSFTTAPPEGRRERFVFTAFGDQGVSYHALANDSLILAQNPAFHLHAGDICYADTSGSGSTDDTYDARVWDQFVAQTESVASRVPWMVTMGNHDMEAWYSPNGYGGHEARFSMPDNGPRGADTPGCYSFVYGNVGVVALDANDVGVEIPANRGLSAGSQTAWLDRRLRSLRARPGVDFVVVFFHYCAYCTTAHASDAGIRDEWVPLFERHTVDLVINGHNHVYERTDAIRRGAVSRPAPVGSTVSPEHDGIVYVTAGGAGAGIYTFSAPESYEGHVHDVEAIDTYCWVSEDSKVDETVEWSRVRYSGYSFLAVESRPALIGGEAELVVSALAENGERIDHVTLVRAVS